MSAASIRKAVAASTGWELHRKSIKGVFKHMAGVVFDDFSQKINEREQLQQKSQAKEAQDELPCQQMRGAVGWGVAAFAAMTATNSNVTSGTSCRD